MSIAENLTAVVRVCVVAGSLHFVSLSAALRADDQSQTAGLGNAAPGGSWTAAYEGLSPAEILVLASTNGEIAIVRKITAGGSDVNAVSEASGEKTAFAAAAAGNHLEVLKFLVSKGATLNDKDGRSSALLAALTHGWPDCAAYLTEQGASCDPNLSAAASGDMAFVEKLLAAQQLDFRMLKQMCAIAGVNGKLAVFIRIFDVLLSQGGQDNWELVVKMLCASSRTATGM